MIKPNNYNNYRYSSLISLIRPCPNRVFFFSVINHCGIFFSEWAAGNCFRGAGPSNGCTFFNSRTKNSLFICNLNNLINNQFVKSIQRSLTLRTHLFWISVTVEIQIEGLFQWEIFFRWVIRLWEIVFEYWFLHFQYFMVKLSEIWIIIGLEECQTGWRYIIL